MNVISDRVNELNDVIQDKIEELLEQSHMLAAYNTKQDCISCYGVTNEKTKELYNELNMFIEMVKHYNPIISKIDINMFSKK
jgi:hypothetical protein